MIRHLVISGFCIFLLGMIAGCNRPQPPAPAVTDPIYTPGLGEIMTLTQMRHTKLWFAGQAGNWPLASYEMDELKEGMEDAVTFHPTHKDSPLPIPQLIDKIMTVPIKQLNDAVDAKDAKQFNKAFDETHLRLQSMPYGGEFRIQCRHPGPRQIPTQTRSLCRLRKANERLSLTEGFAQRQCPRTEKKTLSQRERRPEGAGEGYHKYFKFNFLSVVPLTQPSPVGRGFSFQDAFPLCKALTELCVVAPDYPRVVSTSQF